VWSRPQTRAEPGFHLENAETAEYRKPGARKHGPYPFWMPPSCCPKKGQSRKALGVSSSGMNLPLWPSQDAPKEREKSESTFIVRKMCKERPGDRCDCNNPPFVPKVPRRDRSTRQWLQLLPGTELTQHLLWTAPSVGSGKARAALSDPAPSNHNSFLMCIPSSPPHSL
jgi:hypothetical protein